MKVLFSIGPFDIHFFGVMIAIGALIAISLFIREVQRKGYDPNKLLDGVIYSFIGLLVGARLVYVLVYNPAYYLANPIDVLFIHHGGLSVHGGIIGGLLVAYLFINKHKLPLWKILDIAAPAIVLGIAIGRVGCDVFGAPVKGAPFWAVEFQGELLHPAQAYEFILNYFLFAFLWLKRNSVAFHGQLFAYFLIGYSINRGIVEFSRINPMILGPFSVSHAMSAIGILVGVALIYHLRKQKPEEKPAEITKNDVIQTGAITAGLIAVSLFIYYMVQG